METNGDIRINLEMARPRALQNIFLVQLCKLVAVSIWLKSEWLPLLDAALRSPHYVGRMKFGSKSTEQNCGYNMCTLQCGISCAVFTYMYCTWAWNMCHMMRSVRWETCGLMHLEGKEKNFFCLFFCFECYMLKRTQQMECPRLSEMIVIFRILHITVQLVLETLVTIIL